MASEDSKPDGRPDDQFLSDLSAAIRLKSFLVGGGNEIPKDAAKGLADLVSTFAEDIRVYELKVRYDEWKNSRWWLFARKKGPPDELAAVHDVEKQLRLDDEIAMRLRDNLRKQ